MESDSTPSPHETVTASDWLKPRSPRRFVLVDRQVGVALVTSAVVVTAVLGFWLLGKLSWNHDPLVSQSFQPASFVTLTNRPQSAALEFHQALSSGNFTYAKTLVTPTAMSLVEQAEAQCGSACPTPEQSKGKVFTRATLVETAGRTAVVRAESFDADDTLLKSATYEVSRADTGWLVTAVRPE